MRILILSASLIAATCGPAFAYSNVSPKEAPHVTAADRQKLDSFDPFERAKATDFDSHRYYGGPKTYN
jgi:hypothetical protein